MEITVDKNLCIGCNMCAWQCPRVFKASEDGKAEVIKIDCENCECDIKGIAENCPGNAIKINYKFKIPSSK